MTMKQQNFLNYYANIPIFKKYLYFGILPYPKNTDFL